MTSIGAVPDSSDDDGTTAAEVKSRRRRRRLSHAALYNHRHRRHQCRAVLRSDGIDIGRRRVTSSAANTTRCRSRRHAPTDTRCYGDDDDDDDDDSRRRRRTAAAAGESGA